METKQGGTKPQHMPVVHVTPSVKRKLDRLAEASGEKLYRLVDRIILDWLKTEGK